MGVVATRLPPFLTPGSRAIGRIEGKIVSMHQPISPALDALITQMPKVELHLHLEGSITPGTLLRIAERNHVELPARDEAGVAQLFQYNNFQEFLTVFMVLARSLKRGEDFDEVVQGTAAGFARAQRERGTRVMIAFDYGRQFGIETAWKVLEIA